MKVRLEVSRVDLMRRVLAGSWRPIPAGHINLSELELDEVTPLLYGSGAGGLGWWRLRGTDLHETSSAAVLHQAYRLQILQSGIHEEKIKKVLLLLRQASIEPILIKGWAAAGLYPERGLRPYGDIDLLVRAEQYQLAAELLAHPDMKDCWVDLHRRISELDDRPLEGLFERSRLLPLGEGTVRVLAPEDHLALLAVHLLKHGAWRPVWLCDVSASVEGLPPDFDWNVCLGSRKSRAGWIKSVIRLAAFLLEAKTDHLPKSIREGELPRWLIDAVRKEWQNPFAANQPPMSHPVPIASQWKNPAGLYNALLERWPNPILATVSVNGRFNSFPRLPYQLGNCAMRAVRFLFHAPADN